MEKWRHAPQVARQRPHNLLNLNLDIKHLQNKKDFGGKDLEKVKSMCIVGLKGSFLKDELLVSTHIIYDN